LLIVDIDHFKAVNDTHGHDAGDLVLKEFAKRLEGNVRGVDLSCRYGGEEFVVVMPDTEVNAASMVAERLREQVAAQPFKIGEGDDDTLDLTISIGVAATQGDKTADADQLLQRADQALYRAKNEGRNRVVHDAA
jgi:two-component system cell cycle response regulator